MTATPLIIYAELTNITGMAQRPIILVEGVGDNGMPMMLAATKPDHYPLVAAGDSFEVRKALIGLAKPERVIVQPQGHWHAQYLIARDIVCKHCGTLVCCCEQRAQMCGVSGPVKGNTCTRMRGHVGLHQHDMGVGWVLDHRPELPRLLSPSEADSRRTGMNGGKMGPAPRKSVGRCIACNEAAYHYFGGRREFPFCGSDNCRRWYHHQLENNVLLPL